MRHRYPFDALHWLRHERVDQQAAVVSERAARSAEAKRAEALAEANRASTERAIDELSHAERERLGQGLVRAGELATVGEWRKGAEAELKLKEEREQRARDARIAEVDLETQARQKLGAVSNQAKMIDTHRTDWREERNAALERSEEEAAAEQWNAGHYPPRRG